MFALLLIPLVYLAAVAETSLADAMRVGEVTPELLAMLAVLWLLAAGSPRAFLIAGVITLVDDCIAPGPLGVGAAWMLFIGYGVCRLRPRQKFNHVAIQVPLVFAAVTLWVAATGLTDRFLMHLPLAASVVLGRSLGVGVYTAGIALPVLMVLGWLREPRRAAATAR